MKEAKDGGRWIVRYHFPDGSTDTVDALEAAGQINAGLVKLLRAKRGQRVAASHAGGDATQAAADVQHKDLDDQIRACIERGESTRPKVKDWAVEHQVSRATVYRRIKLYRPK
jgi:hypothetical protein